MPISIQVGFIVLEAVLAPWCEPQEPIYSKLSSINGSDESQLRLAIHELIKPYYDSFEDKSRRAIDQSISYFANGGSAHSSATLESLPLPFDLDVSIQQLCRMLEAELGIISEANVEQSFEYSDDLSLVHRLRRIRSLVGR